MTINIFNVPTLLHFKNLSATLGDSNMFEGATGRLLSLFTQPLFSIPVGIIIVLVIVAGPA